MLVEENVWTMKMTRLDFRKLFDDPLGTIVAGGYGDFLDVDPALYKLYQILNSGVTNGIPVVSKIDLLKAVYIFSTKRIDISLVLAQNASEIAKIHALPNADKASLLGFLGKVATAYTKITQLPQPGTRSPKQAATQEIDKLMKEYSPPPVRLHCMYGATKDYIFYGSAGSPVIMVRCPSPVSKPKSLVVAFLSDLLAATTELPTTTYPSGFQPQKPPKIILKHYYDNNNPSQKYYYAHFDTPVPSGSNKDATMALLADIVMYPSLRIQFLKFAVTKGVVVVEGPTGVWGAPTASFNGFPPPTAQSSLVTITAMTCAAPCVLEVCHKSLITVGPGWNIVGEAHDGSAWCKCPLPPELE